MRAERSSEAVSARLDRLIRGVLEGRLERTVFDRWEMELLLDISAHAAMTHSERRKLLQRYRRAALRAIESGASTPPMLSEYMARGRRQATLKS